jgi:hypothetical protein
MLGVTFYGSLKGIGYMATQAPQNTLMVCLKDVVEGRAGNDRLAEMVANVRLEIDHDREQFNQTVEGLDPAIREAVAGYVDQAHDMLNSYSHALDILDESIRTGSRRKLLQGVDQVGRCIFQCSLAFGVFRDAVLIAQGPTDIPNLNQMLQAYEELMAGQVPEMKLMVVAERERRMSAHELRKLADKPSDLVEVAEVQRAWQAHNDCMVRLLEAINKRDRSAVGIEVDHARDTFAALKAAIPAAEEARLSQGPSPSAIVNMLINTTRDMLDGKVSSDVFTTVLTSLRQNVKDSEAKFEIVTSRPIEQDDLQQAIDKAREAFAEIGIVIGCETELHTRLAAWQDRLVRELRGVDEGVRVLAEPVTVERVMSAHEQSLWLASLHAAPHGVRRMSRALPGVVETSCNLGMVALTPTESSCNFLVRSLIDGGVEMLGDEILSLFSLSGTRASTSGYYPGWAPKPDSPLLALCQLVYRRTYGQGQDATVQVIHAGLECGLIGAKYPGLDIVSFGPTIHGPHAPGEAVEVASVERTWGLLTAILAAMESASR